MKKIFRQHKKILIILCCVLFLVLILNKSLFQKIVDSIPDHNLTPTARAEIIKKDCANNNKQNGSTQCYSEKLYNILLSKNVDYAFETLYSLQNLDPKSKNCHVIAHRMGGADYIKNNNNLQKTLSEVPPVCGYGAAHGAFERFISEGNTLTTAMIPHLCGKIPSWGCIHAVGHVFIIQTNNNVPDALSLCDNFPTKNKQQRNCFNGVFMEHMIGQSLADHGIIPRERNLNYSKYLNEDKKLCQTYSDDKAASCWGQLAHIASTAYGDDIQKVFNFCEGTTQKDSIRTCKRNSITMYLSIKAYDLLDNKFICNLPQQNDPVFRKDCYDMFVGNAINNLPPKDLGSVIVFCSSLDEDYKNECFKTLSFSLGTRKVNIGDRIQICNQAPISYRSICIGKPA